MNKLHDWKFCTYNVRSNKFTWHCKQCYTEFESSSEVKPTPEFHSDLKPCDFMIVARITNM
jgi:hypothetical protein